MPTNPDLIERIAREHAVVRNTVKDIRTELERLRAEPGPGHEGGALPTMLREFGAHLRLHFELEERGGFLEQSEELNPGTQRLIRDLIEQHHDLERQLAALLESVERASEGSASLPDGFVQGLNGFLDDLLMHESTENSLVQELVAYDVGGGD
jgi:hemerythrin-like domain-containing protein